MKAILEKHYWLLLGLIIAFAFLTRIYKVGEIKNYIFDEVYHAVTAKLIRQNDPRAFEWWNEPPEPDTAVDWLHPPLAKYTQAVSMSVFGETPFGWRFSSVIFGTLVIFATALLAKELFDDKLISLLAAFLASLDGLLLVQSRIAMNDIHVTFFILLTLWLYLKYKKSQLQPRPSQFLFFLTGLSAGLACASKWSGAFVVGTVLFFESIEILKVIWAYLINYRDTVFLKQHIRAKDRLSTIKNTFETFFSRKAFKTILATTAVRGGKLLIFMVILPAVIYVLGYWQMFLQGKSLVCENNFVLQGTCYCEQTNSVLVQTLKSISPQNKERWEAMEARGGCLRLISHFSELHTQIWWYQTNLKATHSYQSRPWQWFLDVKPVWMYVSGGTDYTANIYAQGNPLLFWIGDAAILFSIAFVLSKLIKREPLQFSLKYILFAYFAVWIFWQFSPRIMFFYHYTPAVPLLSIILSYWLVKLSNIPDRFVVGKYELQISHVLVSALISSIILTFILFYPNWTGRPVPLWLADQVYFFIPSWR